MYITFLIGNGFDVNLGLDTRYSDFYPFFLDKAHKDNMIREWISNNVDEWSDLELELGRHLEKLSNENLQDFFSAKDELDLLLGQYIEEQQNNIGNEKIQLMSVEFVRSISKFEYGLPNVEKTKIQSIKSAYYNQEFEYHFLDFNYTDIIDRLIELVGQKESISKHAYKGSTIKEVIGRVVHVHGTTNSNMILGINDISQINNTLLANNIELQDYIIKERINAGLKQNTVRMAKGIIDKSHIICVYGMSLGDTDNMWWQYIINWLLTDNSNTLIIYNYYKDVDKLKKLPARKVQKTNEVIRKFLNKMKLSEHLYNKISSKVYVVFENNIFKFDTINNNSLGNSE